MTKIKDGMKENLNPHEVWLGFMAFQPLLVIKCQIIFIYIYIYIYNLWIHFVDTFLNEPELILLYTVKWFQVFLSKHRYFYLLLIIHLYTVKWFQVFVCNSKNAISVIICLHTVKWFQVLIFNTTYLIQHYSFVCTVKWFQVLLCITNNTIKHQSFVYIQLNDQTVLFLTIQFSISHLFVLSLDVKQFY